MVSISVSEYKEACDLSMGWCTVCEDFTRGECEPDAEGYECPVCEGFTVEGAENALISEKFELEE